MNRRPLALRPTPTRRSRRGVETVEFALIFPIFMFVFFGIMEYSWYFFQRAAVVDVTRAACRAGALVDPDTEAPDVVATSVVMAELANNAGINCASTEYDCVVSITNNWDPPNNPPRMTCQVSVNFRGLTGFLGSDDNPGGAWAQLSGGGNVRLIPSEVEAVAVAIFDEADE